MKRRMSLGVCVAFSAAAAIFPGLNESVVNDSLAQDYRTSVENSDQQDRILVLRDGRVMHGRIRTVSTGYLVASSTYYLGWE